MAPFFDGILRLTLCERKALSRKQQLYSKMGVQKFRLGVERKSTVRTMDQNLLMAFCASLSEWDSPKQQLHIQNGTSWKTREIRESREKREG
jgi:hypothetical protein